MQGEDDLRGLAKIMAFMRAVSILLILMHFYWFCYSFFLEKGWTLQVINKILDNFQRTASLFSHTIYTNRYLFFSHSVWYSMCRYYWQHVPDGPNGCGGAHLALNVKVILAPPCIFH